MTYHTKAVGTELKRWQQVQEALAGDDLDIETLVDTLDGETELFEALCAVKESALEDKAAIDGLDRYIGALKLRRDRITKSMQAKDAVILSAMERAEIPRIKSPAFTMSKGKVPPKVIINNEADIPSRFFKQPDPIVDKKAIKEALAEGEVPGAQMSNGGIKLTTRIL